ncbi:hypothetical protein [Dongshaea marina]|uniref:hypothetical protein n=1 Tax=Dongshaea marina TaxID=2047966 RepID=UPI00131F1879|nr:hypothetical protein [Dongshaea marina]
MATDRAIASKEKAIREVVHYIHRAGGDIELARKNGGQQLDVITEMIRKHIPEHNREAIIQSLRLDLDVINYRNLDVDENAKGSMRQIMELAIEGGMLKQRIDIDAFAEQRFNSQLIDQH